MEREKARQLFARANEFKEGDLAVGGTVDDVLRLDAKQEIAAMKIGEIAEVVFVDDAITLAISGCVSRPLLNEIAQLKIAELKTILLSDNCAKWANTYCYGMPSEVMAAVVKIMNNEELSYVSRSLFHALPGKTGSDTIVVGSGKHFGSRIQPNSPGDNDEEILLSILEGLAFGCGDVIIGLNPASDDLATVVRIEKILQSVVERLQLPTRYAVLSDMIKQSTARLQTKVDVGFQSLAGTSKSLVGMLGVDVEGLLELAKGFNGLYFETGQGSEVTNGAAEGVDMVTLEARCYGLARYLRQQCGGKWLIVNDVAGFIGPEVFKTGSQLVRACLEDTVMAKLHGITMGLDVCSTFHMGIDPSELHALTGTIVQMAAPAYLMSVAGNADPMLGYLTTSYREHPRLRKLAGKQISSAMKERLTALGVVDSDGEATGAPAKSAILYARYMREGGDRRTMARLTEEGLRKIAALQEKGCDLGYGIGPAPDYAVPLSVSARLDTMYRHARSALYAKIDTAVIRDCSPHHFAVASCSVDREDYLAHPSSGEFIVSADADALRNLYAVPPQILCIISDGLNADAVNENLRNVLPLLKYLLKEGGFRVGVSDIIITNGRVRAGYHAAQIIEPEILIHLIGERPGTGLNQLSAYMTYGKDAYGTFRWRPELDHSCTTAICSINSRGKKPESAVTDMVACITRMIRLECSGVLLGNAELLP